MSARQAYIDLDLEQDQEQEEQESLFFEVALNHRLKRTTNNNNNNNDVTIEMPLDHDASRPRTRRPKLQKAFRWFCTFVLVILLILLLVSYHHLLF